MSDPRYRKHEIVPLPTQTENPMIDYPKTLGELRAKMTDDKVKAREFIHLIVHSKPQDPNVIGGPLTYWHEYIPVIEKSGYLALQSELLQSLNAEEMAHNETKKERDGLRAECDKWKALVLTDQNKKNVYLENQLRRNQEGCSCPLPTFNGSPFDGIGYGCKLHGR